MLLQTIFSTIKDDEQIYVWQKKENSRVLVDSAEDALKTIQDYADSDLYFGVAPRKRGKYDEVSRVTTLWVDIDAKSFNSDKTKTYQQLETFPFLPTFIIDSGHGFHAYWVLTESVSSEEAQRIMRSMCTFLHCDPCHNAKWVLRIPGSKNYKSDKVEDVSYRSINTNLIYNPKDLSACCLLGNQAVELIYRGSSQGTRSEKDWFVLNQLLSVGMSEEGIRTIAETRPIGERWREDNGRKLDIDLQKARGNQAYVDDRFFPSGDVMYWRGAKANSVIATFVFDPEILLTTGDGQAEDAFYGTVHSSGQTWRGVTIPTGAFISDTKMCTFLGNAHWSWMGSTYQTKMYSIHLMKILEEKGMPTAHRTSVIGRHGDYWVSKFLTLSEDTVYVQEEDAPWVYLNPKGTRESKQDPAPNPIYIFPSDEEYADTVQRVAELLPKVNLSQTIIPIIGWIFATPYKPLLREADIPFPHLNIYGTMGSGKTSTLLNIFMPLLGMKNAKTESAATTRFVLLKTFSSSNSIPVVFGEYREDTVSDARDFFTRLRMAYDSGVDFRGHRDQTTETFFLDRPVIVDGEDTFSDPALRQRSIFVNTQPRAIKAATSYNDAFFDMLDIDLTSFAGKFIMYTLSKDADYIKEKFNSIFSSVKKTLKVKGLHERVIRNISVCVFDLEMLNEYLESWGGQRIEWKLDDFQETMGNVLFQLANGSTRTMVDSFIEYAVNEIVASDISRSPDFKSFYDYKENILWIHTHSAFGSWRKEMRRQGQEVLRQGAIRRQLEERVEDDSNYAVGYQGVTPSSYDDSFEPPTLMCFGINVAEAKKSGLDIPESLDRRKFRSWGCSIEV